MLQIYQTQSGVVCGLCWKWDGDLSRTRLHDAFTGFCEKEGALQARYLKTSGAAQQKLVLFGAAPCCSVLVVWLESLRFTEAFHTSLMEPAGSSDVPCRFMRVCESASGAPLYTLCDHHL